MSATETEIFSPTYRVNQQAKQPKSGFWHLLTLLRSHYWLMTLTIGSGILNQGMTIASAAVGAYLVGLAVVTRSIAPLLPWLVALGLLVLGRAVMLWVEMWLAHDLAYRILADIRGRLYWALEQLAPSYLLDRRSGDIAAAAMGDAETLEFFYAHTAGSAIVALIVALAALLTLAAIYWALSLVLLPWIVLVVTVPFWFTRRAAKQGKRLRSQLGEVNADVVDGVQGLREVVAFGQDRIQLEKLGQRNVALVDAQLAQGKRVGLEKAITNAFVALGMLSVLALSAVLVSQGILAKPLFPVSIRN